MSLAKFGGLKVRAARASNASEEGRWVLISSEPLGYLVEPEAERFGILQNFKGSQLEADPV